MMIRRRVVIIMMGMTMLVMLIMKVERSTKIGDEQKR